VLARICAGLAHYWLEMAALTLLMLSGIIETVLVLFRANTLRFCEHLLRDLAPLAYCAPMTS